jgi:hypothetical protein
MSIYEESTLGEPDNQIVFNNPDVDPFYRIKTRMPQKYQLRQEDFPVPFDSGISDFLTLIGQTVYILSGIMYPSTESSYDAGQYALRAVTSLSLEQADPYQSDEGYVPYMWGDASGANAKQLFVKALYVMMTEDTKQGLQQPFQIVCKIKDPTIYGTTLKIASTAQANPSVTTGAAALPFALPIAIGSTLYTVSANANNIGLTDTDPQSITIYGPIVNPRITNGATGEFIEVDVTLATSSDVLLIQYSKDSLVVTLDGVSVLQYVTGSSTFFKIIPGVNTMQLTGQVVSTGAYAEVAFYDAWDLA